MCRQTVILLFMTLGMTSAAVAMPQQNILWFSDVAPKRMKVQAKTDHSGHVDHAKEGKHQESMDAVIGGQEGGGLHSGTKRLWLRQGEDLLMASYVENSALDSGFGVLDVRGNRSQVAQTPMGGLVHGQFEFEEMGFYNAYLSRESVKDGVRHVQLAKAELLKGTCCRQEFDPIHDKAISDPDLPLEIVREHEADEKLNTRVVSGDKIRFIVNRLGKPLAGAPITMLTQQGWQKKAVSDEGGRVEFIMIRDYFPSWNDFKRRTKETFVIIAEAEAAESGELHGQPYAKAIYQATLSGRYSPSPYDYKSYAWGLGVAVFVFAFGGLGVYLYRRRRIKPFKEVRFSEST
jgi:hypothetical protein